MKEDHNKQQNSEKMTLTPFVVVKWILMIITVLFLAYMAFKFLIPKVAYS